MILINTTQTEIELKLGNLVVPARDALAISDAAYVSNRGLRDQIDALLTSGELITPPNVTLPPIMEPQGNRAQGPIRPTRS